MWFGVSSFVLPKDKDIASSYAMPSATSDPRNLRDQIGWKLLGSNYHDKPRIITFSAIPPSGSTESGNSCDVLSLDELIDLISWRII